MEWENFQAYFYLLGLPLIAFLLWKLAGWRQKVSNAFGNASIPRWGWGEWVRFALILIGWSGIVVGLMGPYNPLPTDETGQIFEEEVVEKGRVAARQRRRLAHDVILLIDASASMEVRDTRTGDTRLGHAKEIAEALLEELHGESVALYAFTSQVSALVPSTMDYFFSRLMLRGMRVNEGDVAGTDLVETLDFLKTRHLQKDSDQLKTVVLFTDGGDTRLESMEGRARQQEIEAILSRIGDPLESNLRLYTIGLGSSEGEVIPGVEFEGEPVRSSLDERLLAQLAERGRGEYYFANGYSTLSIVEDLLARARSEQTSYLETGKVQTGIKLRRLQEGQVYHQPLFQWPASVAFIALLIALLLPESLVRKARWLPLFLPIFLSGSIQSDFSKAEGLSRQGRYDASIQAYQELLSQRLDEKQRSIIYYNLGRVFLQAKDYGEARIKFQQVMDGSGGSALLRKRAAVNLLHSLLREADSRCDYHFERTSGFPDECQEALQLLETANRLYSDAEQMEGEVEELLPLKELIRERLVWMREYARRHALTMLELPQAVERARQALIERQQQVEELLLSNDDDPSREFLLIKLEEQKQTELWREIRTRLSDPDRRQEQPLFMKAEAERLQVLESKKPERGRRSLGLAMTALHGLSLQLQGVDIAEALLADRVDRLEGMEKLLGKILRWRKEDLSASEELIAALLDPDRVEDEKLKRIFQLLQGRIPDRKFAEADHILYRQLKQSESDVLLALYEKGAVAELGALKTRWEVARDLGEEKARQALATLQEQEPPSTQMEWQQLVKRLLKIWDPKLAFRIDLEELAKAFEAPIKADKIGTATVGRLKVDTDRVMSEIDTLDDPLQQRLTSPSEIVRLRLKQAAEALRIGRPLHARAYALDALEWIHRMIHMLLPPLDSPQKILQWGIQEAEHGVVLNTWIHLMQEKERLERGVADALSSSQALVPESVVGFEEQQVPEEAMKLFKEGLEAAHEADKALSLRKPKLSDGLRYQQITLEKWEQALKLISDDPPPQDQDGEGESNDESKPQDQSDTSAQELLRLLQQLENEDRDQENNEGMELKKGQRPW